MNNYKKISSHGAIGIPVAMRREIGIEKGDPMELSLEGGAITIRPYTPRCIFCGTTERTDYKLNGRTVCRNCSRMMAELMKGGSKE